MVVTVMTVVMVMVVVTVTMVTVMVVRPCVRACAWGHLDGCWPRGRCEGAGWGWAPGAGERLPRPRHQRFTRKTCSISCRTSSPGTRCGPRPARCTAACSCTSWRTSLRVPFLHDAHLGGGGRVSTAAGPQLSRRDRNHRTLSLEGRVSQTTAEHPARHKALALGAGCSTWIWGHGPVHAEGNMMPGGAAAQDAGRGAEADSPSSLRGSTALQSLDFSPG